MAGTFKLKLKRSLIGSTDKQRATIKGLGLSKIGSEAILKDTPAIRGMIFRMQHLLEVSRGK
jgi:large subunit ribosomal protein L30